MDNGDIYKGNWKNDTRYGAGICQFANGTIYKGDWKDDMPHGIGTFFTGPGELIEAKFQKGIVVDGPIKILVSYFFLV